MSAYVEATGPLIKGRIKHACAVELVLGVWLVVTAFWLATAWGELVNALVCGIAVAVLAALRIWHPTLSTKPASVISMAIGAWLIVAPFVLGYRAGPAAWNDAVVGLFVLIFAGWSGAEPRTVAPSIARNLPDGAPVNEGDTRRVEHHGA